MRGGALCVSPSMPPTCRLCAACVPPTSCMLGSPWCRAPPVQGMSWEEAAIAELSGGQAGVGPEFLGLRGQGL